MRRNIRTERSSTTLDRPTADDRAQVGQVAMRAALVRRHRDLEARPGNRSAAIAEEAGLVVVDGKLGQLGGDERAVHAEIDKRGHRHVAGDARRAVEIKKRGHARS
jgi:hypothetical protein